MIEVTFIYSTKKCRNLNAVKQPGGMCGILYYPRRQLKQTKEPKNLKNALESQNQSGLKEYKSIILYGAKEGNNYLNYVINSNYAYCKRY